GHVYIDAPHADIRAHHAALRIQRSADKGRVREAVWVFVLGSVAEDRRSSRAIILERRHNKARRIALQSVFAVAQRHEIMEESEAAADHPLSVTEWIVSYTRARA